MHVLRHGSNVVANTDDITVPAGTLANDGDMLEIELTGMSSGLGSSTVTFMFGPVGDFRQITGAATALGGDPFLMNVRLTRTSQTQWEARIRWWTATGVVVDGATQTWSEGSEDQILDFDVDDVTLAFRDLVGSGFVPWDFKVNRVLYTGTVLQ